jgi:hypothetical protein
VGRCQRPGDIQSSIATEYSRFVGRVWTLNGPIIGTEGHCGSLEAGCGRFRWILSCHDSSAAIFHLGLR